MTELDRELACSTADGRRAGDALKGVRVLYVVNVDWFFLSHRLPLALAAKQFGAEVCVAAADTGRASEIERHGLRFLPIPLSRGGRNPLRELATLARVTQLLRATRPTLIHHVTTKPVLYGSFASRIVARRAGVVNAIAGFGYALASEQRGWLRPVVLRAYRAALRHPRSRTIFQNSEDLVEFVRSGLIDRRQAVLIRGSGVDCSEFRPSPEPAGPPIVLLASRMLWEKGVGDFVDAARRLRRERPDVRFVLVGMPDQENPGAISIGELQTWASEGVVEWWGRRTDMPDVFRQSQVIVLPTFYREGVPKVLVEAAASGRPIVTTDIPGCRDIVRHGVNGLLVPPRDPVTLAVAVKSLIDDPPKRQCMGARGRDHALRGFAIGGVIDRTLSLYRELLVSDSP
jgi:glycosyltransferase involved in cell wall biosynthesis